jgi:hypothetical protein
VGLGYLPRRVEAIQRGISVWDSPPVRGEQIGDVTYHSSDSDISKLVSSEFAPKIGRAHPADSHIRFRVNSLRSSGWVFRSTIPFG